jgi:hypothetical protein
MGISNAEIVRLRAELGYNAVQVSNPYLTSYALFETVIAQYVEAGGDTTSSTPVIAQSSPTAIALTLASVPTDSNGNALVALDQVVIDVDSLLERVTVQSISGSVITVLLQLAHSGTYPVSVDGGVAMVREKLAYIRNLTAQIQKMMKAAGVSKTDDVEFHKPNDMVRVLGPAGAVWEQREWERAELADFLGVVYLRGMREQGGGSVTAY